MRLVIALAIMFQLMIMLMLIVSPYRPKVVVAVGYVAIMTILWGVLIKTNMS
jgi:hypothetical protein